MQPDEEDKAFWLAQTNDVKHIKNNEKYVETRTNLPQTRIKPHEHQYFAIIQDFSTYSKALEDYDATSFGGIDKHTLQKFKREEFTIEATLDLHGKTETAAYEAVDDFIPRCYATGKRCVCIVTGKGLNIHPDTDVLAAKGVLRQLVPQWLNEPRLRGMLMIYKHPSERLGGLGAIYILLRRNLRR